MKDKNWAAQKREMKRSEMTREQRRVMTANHKRTQAAAKKRDEKRGKN